MDIQRYLLIGAMALLSWMLLTEWVVFKDNQAQITTASFSTPDTNEQPTQSTVLASDSDIPDLVSIDSSPAVGGYIVLHGTHKPNLRIQKGCRLSLEQGQSPVVAKSSPQHPNMLENTTLELKTGSSLHIERGGRLVLKAGTTLLVQPGANLIKHKGGKLKVHKQAKIVYVR